MLHIGKIVKIHGVKGHVIFEHTLKESSDFDNWDALMIELHPKSYIPFFIEEIREFSDKNLLVKVEEINSPEEAKSILQKEVYASPNVEIEEDEVETDIISLIGFTLYDGENKVGMIENLLNPNLSPLFILNEDKENEILIPANEELIVSIDCLKKEIIMKLPEGLI